MKVSQVRILPGATLGIPSTLRFRGELLLPTTSAPEGAEGAAVATRFRRDLPSAADHVLSLAEQRVRRVITVSSNSTGMDGLAPSTATPKARPLLRIEASGRSASFFAVLSLMYAVNEASSSMMNTTNALTAWALAVGLRAR